MASGARRTSATLTFGLLTSGATDARSPLFGFPIALAFSPFALTPFAFAFTLLLAFMVSLGLVFTACLATVTGGSQAIQTTTTHRSCSGSKALDLLQQVAQIAVGVGGWYGDRGLSGR